MVVHKEKFLVKPSLRVSNSRTLQLRDRCLWTEWSVHAQRWKWVLVCWGGAVVWERGSEGAGKMDLAAVDLLSTAARLSPSAGLDGNS